MQNANRPPVGEHTLTLTDRSTATVTGVEDVDCFSDEMAVITTSMGAITISGSGLKVARLDLMSGEVSLEGRIDALEYGAARKSGLFSRLLR